MYSVYNLQCQIISPTRELIALHNAPLLLAKWAFESE